MDECTASNNSSLNEKKTWLIIETSETQAEIEVEGSAGCRPAWGGVCVLLWGVDGHRRCGEWVDGDLGEVLAPLCPPEGSCGKPLVT